MPLTTTARRLRAAGRLVEGSTRLVERAPPCTRCRAEGLSTDGLVEGKTKTGEGAVLCERHFAKEGVGLGLRKGTVLIATGPACSVERPRDSVAAGYARAILDYRLAVLPPHRLTFVATRGARRERVEDGRAVVVLPASYAPASGLVEHLEFALKHDGVNLEVLGALFRRVDEAWFERELTAFVKRRPTGKYARRLWFLYELLTSRRLALKDVVTGNYVELLDEAANYTGMPQRSRRHRVVNNLLGDVNFCPTVRRTPALKAFEESGLKDEAVRIMKDFDQDTLRRAVSYLYTKETRSSFDIEGEKPSPTRAERFVGLLRSVADVERMTEADLVRLQNATVDERFADSGWRRDQVYIAEQVDLARQRIHYIAPKPEEVGSMMEGLLACLPRLAKSGVDAVVQAALISFGFVFIHPFSDGNGRLHRLLIHHVLARRGFTPKGLIFPVSAVMLQRRVEYDACLERFSVPLMRLVDYEENDTGSVVVKNDTAGLYRFFDATPMAEALAGWVAETVKIEFRAELDFVMRYRATRKALEAIVELPDRLLNLFIKVCLNNQGRLSSAKRKHFAMLSDAEVKRMERAVRDHLKVRTPAAQS
jgi:hypothetical protein